MSIEAAKSFIERMKTDEAFAKKVTACKDAEERSEVVREEGFDFTASELREAGTVLSDDDLEGVAGGQISELQISELNFTIN
jgi:predicted ribosomally synthesized peptide with nif11-like leader